MRTEGAGSDGAWSPRPSRVGGCWWVREAGHGQVRGPRAGHERTPAGQAPGLQVSGELLLAPRKPHASHSGRITTTFVRAPGSSYLLPQDAHPPAHPKGPQRPPAGLPTHRQQEVIQGEPEPAGAPPPALGPQPPLLPQSRPPRLSFPDANDNLSSLRFLMRVPWARTGFCQPKSPEGRRGNRPGLEASSVS